MDLKEARILSESDVTNHWYYEGKFLHVESLLHGKTREKLLDYGAGSGVFSKKLINANLVESSVCYDPFYEEDEKKDGKIIFKKKISNEEADSAIAIDVLEHVDNDVEVLNDITLNLKDGASLVVSVPAFNFLWSEHDDFLEHKRRYTVDSLKESLEKANLEIEKIGYVFPSLFLAAFVKRRLFKEKKKGGSDLVKVNRVINKILLFFLKIEKLFIPISKLFGLSVVAKCKYKKGPIV